jgi:hypothetical protein
VSITESKLVVLPVEVMPLDKGITSSGIPDRILDLDSSTTFASEDLAGPPRTMLLRISRKW